jgi:hypothetical protein
MALAPEISAFGDDLHEPGETGLTISGGGFGAFPGSAWIYQNADRSGAADELIVGSWNDIELSVDIPGSLNNSEGTAYLFVQREDLAWSQGYQFALGDEPPIVIEPPESRTIRVRKVFRELRV